jgi:hypothetical protein
VARTLILLVAVAFIGLFAMLTISVIARRGLDVLSVASLVIVAILGFGVIGALRTPPQK